MNSGTHDRGMVGSNEEAVRALTNVIYDGTYQTCDLPLLEVFDHELFRRAPHLSFPDRARLSYEQLRHVTRCLGPAREVVQNKPLLFALFEWAAILAGDLGVILSGHYNLAVAEILALGEGREDLEPLLAELDDATSVGFLLLTEVGYGSNVFNLETEAVYDEENRTFVINTPSPAARKFMPNIADADVPKLGIVVARLWADGQDYGIFPFVFPMRYQNGELADGVSVVNLPDKPFVAMDNAITTFDHVRVPASSLLGGGIAGFDADGRFHCEASPRSCYRRTIETINTGRIALSNAVVASARAALLITLRYAQQRLTIAAADYQVPMMSHTLVQRGLLVGLARTYAATVLANRVKRIFVEFPDDPERCGLPAMVAKPFLSWTSLEVMQECRERCGAAGLFSVNRIADYLGQCQGVITAEGENQVLQVTAGRRLLAAGLHRTPNGAVAHVHSLDDPGDWVSLLLAREQRLGAGAEAMLISGGSDAKSRFDLVNDQAAVLSALADTHAHRLALEELLSACNTIPSVSAAALLEALARIFVLDYVNRHGGWYAVEGLVDAGQLRTIDADIGRACANLVDHVGILTDAFAIPDTLLGAPVASPDYVAAWDDMVTSSSGGEPCPPSARVPSVVAVT